MKALVVFGTRPEAIKLAPVIHALMKRSPRMSAVVCVTAQHREMLDSVLRFFSISVDHDLDLMRPDQTLTGLTTSALAAVGDVLARERPDVVIVQGDTTTTMVTALAAFYARVPIAHVEAGLRTGDKYAPYPEEVNRRITSVMTDLFFPPTERARQNLLAEGFDDRNVHVTGNTVVDALLMARDKVQGSATPPRVAALLPDGAAPVVLVTAHRRESFGPSLRSICVAVRDLVDRNPDLTVAFPVHLNPNVRREVAAVLRPSPACGDRLVLTDPVDYPELVWLLDRCRFVLTDSGGIQEEAPTFAKPVLVMRDVTERPEGVDAGIARLVGTDRAAIVREAERLLRDERAYAEMTGAPNPYGDGQAAERIVTLLAERFSAPQVPGREGRVS